MRILIFIGLVSALCQYTRGQYSSRQQLNSDRGQGSGWDIRLAVPGEPGTDYPTLATIPKTSFSCSGKTPGYYADLETSCQAFRICTLGSTYGFQSFLCPNGTLFNQKVFVCDWWMNVNCQESQKYMSINNDKYGKLRLGPHLMSDIKNMLTHSMRTPYDRSNIKSNYVVMQEYQPPGGQLFANGAIRANYDRDHNSINVPPRQLQLPFNQNFNTFQENIVSASSPNPLYIPAVFNNGQPNQDNIETLQRQIQSGRYVQNNQVSPGFSNAHSGRLTLSNFENGNSQTKTQSQFKQGNYQYNQQYQNQLMNMQAYSTQNSFSNNRNNDLNSQYRYNTIGNQENGRKHTEFGISFKREHLPTPTLESSNKVSGQLNEAKENLVSQSYTPPTVLTKTLTLDKIVKGSKLPNPSSRLTFKSWIIRPAKAARLTSDPTAYTYTRPTNPPQSAKLISQSTGYIYNKPSTTISAKLISETGYYYDKPSPTLSAKLISEPGYTYNKPPTTISAKLISEPGYVYNNPVVTSSKLISNSGYFYDKPTTTPSAKLLSEPGYVYDKPSSKLISTTELSRLYLAPTTNKPTTSNRLYLAPTVKPSIPSRLYLAQTTMRPTLPSRLYLSPTTYKPSIASRLYVPPVQDRNIFSQQRLHPSANIQPFSPRNADLQVSPTSPTPVYLSPEGSNLHKPSFTLTKHSYINANHNNLTFTDILTKEKLDITVNNIVKDTSNILHTVSNDQFGQLREENKDINYPEENYLPPDDSLDSNVESINTQDTGSEIIKSGKIIASPSTELEPPVESIETNIKNSNSKFAALPFYKESLLPSNTIERTVSLKISIPEKTAEYLFQTRNDSEFDKLEILNTGSSNYLVLTNNNNKNKLSQSNFIPIGKLVINPNSNFSNSQALVYSFLADSLNIAKNYKNVVDKRLQPNNPYENAINEDISHIANKVSDLTSSQYGQNSNTLSSSKNTILNSQNSVDNSNTLAQNQVERNENTRLHLEQKQLNTQNILSNTVSSNDKRLNAKLQESSIYSGQLYQIPVPDVSSQIFNNQNEENVNENKELEDLQKETNDNDLNNSSEGKQSSAEVEIIKSHTLPISTPAKLQEAPVPNQDLKTNQDDDTTQQIFRNLLNSNEITAQLRDRIIGSLNHPVENDKVVTYKKDQSYYLITKIGNKIRNEETFNQHNKGERSGKLIQTNNADNSVTFQFIPSIGFQVDDVNDQQKILDTFQINEFGRPKTKPGDNSYENHNVDSQKSEIDYSVQHSITSKPNGQYRNIDTLYSGPSSYSAPQASVGRLDVQQRSGKLVSNPTSNGYKK